jgi:hypothetical protein
MRQGPSPFRRLERAGAGSIDPNVVALLSLKLLLLAFFILLTTLARFQDDKVTLVVNSVNDAFHGQVRAEEDHAPVAAALDAVGPATQLSRRVRNLFVSTLPVATAEADEALGELRLELPVQALFRPGAPELKAGPAILFDRLAGMLGPDADPAVSASLELLVGVPRDALARLAGAPEALPPRRAGVLARDLLGRGMPGERLSVGLLPGLDGQVRLVLRVRQVAPVERDTAPQARP